MLFLKASEKMRLEVIEGYKMLLFCGDNVENQSFLTVPFTYKNPLKDNSVAP
jgi:hypothetical protein